LNHTALSREFGTLNGKPTRTQRVALSAT
jgi:hypothetical protein